MWICNYSETLKPIINLPDYTPHKVTVNGNTVMLMCLAHGRSKIGYHWEHRLNDFSNWAALSGEVNSGLLILSSVTEDNEGMYRCVACDCYSCSYSINTTTIIVYGKKQNIYVANYDFLFIDNQSLMLTY